MNLKEDGNKILRELKQSPYFPFKTGKLKFQATKGELITPTLYRIRFDTSVANYIPYLEEGTTPHDIPGAFGRPFPFGVGGKFQGQFHPGSRKHQYFISHWAVGECIDYFVYNYKGVQK